METIELAALFAIAILGGGMNAVAGGGSFLTFPAMIFYGATPMQANVTSTLALAPSGITSAYAFRRALTQEDKNTLPLLLVISALGSAIGAIVLLSTPERIFEGMVPWLLLFATLLFTFGKHIIARVHFIRSPFAARAAQLAIAFYGGYFGAGMGIMMLAMLQLLGMKSIHRMNAVKTILGCAINGMAIIFYALSAHLLWREGAVMIVGGMLGGYAAAHYSQKLPEAPVRWFISTIGFTLTAYFFLGA